MAVHVRYDGQSYDFTFEQLDVGDLSSDGQIREAVASALDSPVAKLNNFTVDRQGDEITLRPQASFGS